MNFSRFKEIMLAIYLFAIASLMAVALASYVVWLVVEIWKDILS
jgi:hypothetical protein